MQLAWTRAIVLANRDADVLTSRCRLLRRASDKSQRRFHARICARLACHHAAIAASPVARSIPAARIDIDLRLGCLCQREPCPARDAGSGSRFAAFHVRKTEFAGSEGEMVRFRLTPVMSYYSKTDAYRASPNEISSVMKTQSRDPVLTRCDDNVGQIEPATLLRCNFLFKNI